MTNDDTGTDRLVSISPAAIHRLRVSLENHLGDGAAAFLQEAGYASGEGVYNRFTAWLHENSGITDPSELDSQFLTEMLAGYFSGNGWGSLDLEQVGPAGMIVSSRDWAEADTAAVVSFPSCHFTTGMLADFMTRLAGATVAVMEVECRSRRDDRCAFLIGSPDTLQTVYSLLRDGKDYKTALAG